MGRLLTLGHVQRAHGVRGLLRVRLDLEDTSWLLPGTELLVGSIRRELRSFGPAPGGAPNYLIGFEGLLARHDAEALKGQEIAIDRQQLPELAEDEGFYVQDLVGLQASTVDGEALGKVHEVYSLAGRLLARVDAGLIPLDGPTIDGVDFESGQVVFDLPEGLFEAQK
jgi:16S rRNA processing protein RimM